MARYKDDDNQQQEQEYRPRRFRGEDEAPAEVPVTPAPKQSEPKAEKPQPAAPKAEAPKAEKQEQPKKPERVSVPAPQPQKPKKKRRKSTPILIILLIVAILVFLGSAGMLVWEMVIQPSMSDSDNEEIRAVATESASSALTDGGTERATVDFDSLRGVNEDIVGWITIPNTIVDYPVLQSSPEDPEYYLYRNYKKEDTKYGSIFLDASNTITPGDRNAKSQTLYGHHMDDGRMFADILKYGDLDFYKSAPTFIYDTYLEQGDWKVISVFKTNVLTSQGELFQYVRPAFADTADFLNFVHNVMIRSIIDTGVTVNENDQLLVLSTCSYEYENFRTVIVARKVRAGESAEVDTSKAVYRNEATLYPDCWYWSGDGAAPVYPATFAEAMQQGMTTWYDGSLKVR